MFVKKGPLSKVWLAAHFHRKLNKQMVQGTDICLSAKSVTDPASPLALRLSGQLLLGLVRIYQKKVKYLQEDCSDALSKMKMVLRQGTVDLPADSMVAPAAQITHPDSFDGIEFNMPDMTLDSFDVSMASQSMQVVDHFSASQQQITLEEQGEEMRDMNLLDIEFDGELLPFDDARDVSEVEFPRAADEQGRDVFDLATPNDMLLSGVADSSRSKGSLAADMSMFDESFGPAQLDLRDEPLEVSVAQSQRKTRPKRKVKRDERTELASKDINEALKDTSDTRLTAGRPTIPFSKRAKLEQASQASLAAILRQPSGLADVERSVAPELWEVVELSLLETSQRVEAVEELIQPPESAPLEDLIEFEAPEFAEQPEALVEAEEEAKHLEPVYEDDLEHDRQELDAFFGQQKGKRGEEEEAEQGDFSFRTKKMQQLLKNRMARTKSVGLMELCEGHSRKVAANIFYQLLVLKSHSVIQVNQKAPYQDIRISDLKAR